ncbi:MULTISPECIES: alpha-1,2-fucosyltransferase [unclassified Bacteroides]|uniref:alpha-1,2-fucosyltransferase n=1 Tax=unclassified Bacteroides TaxID=2646097 RepID=UPI000B3A77F3|nr:MULTISPECIES: alpha-1,2-fucosyltransferase [unclassified Bacteroides]OUN82337.1 alpha-1,2-fucosyltransferase [Bacteroides sp. An51A]OUO82661.1 alpha-1,2-fucosyltransferase [Bacteroides sp. An269]
MRLIKVTGGLGNQMFIYACYLQMKKRFPRVYIDLTDMMHYHVHYGYEMHRVFGLPCVEICMNQVLKKVIEFLFFKTILERKQHGSMRPYTRSYLWPLIYFKGFYQSEKYFADIKDEVRQAFTFDLKQANGQSLRMREQIDKDEHAVSLHVRRGDYLQPKHWEAIGCICQLSYYRNALEEMGKRVERPRYYVFSDDLAWVKENLDLPDAVYIDWNKGEDSWQDMMLMSRCRHHIICNSTFSWWGAWLNPRNGKIVIAPERWTRDADSREIVPAEWLRVSIK